MRLILDTLVALILVAVLAGLLWQLREEQVHWSRVEQVRQAIQVIQSQSLYHAAVGDVEATPHGHSRRIEADWFDPRPENSLLRETPHRWLDRAEKEDYDRFDPPRIVADRSRAAFWYNPGRGLIRARVPMQLSHQATVDLYNLVNDAMVGVEDVEWSSSNVQAGGETADPTSNNAVLRDFRRR